MKKINKSWFVNILKKKYSHISIIGFLIVSILLIFITHEINKSDSNLDSFGNIIIKDISGDNAKVTNNININPSNESIKKLPDSINCCTGENWCGMSNPIVDYSGKAIKKRRNYIFNGAFRWSPIINDKNQTSEGEICIFIRDKKTIIYSWKNPNKAYQEFSFPIKELENYKGEYKIRWQYLNGTSGFCIMKSEVKTTP